MRLSSMKPRDARSRKEAYDLGMMYFKQGNRSKANKAWIKAVDVTPAMAWNLIKVSICCQNSHASRGRHALMHSILGS